jgi:hypothetical protein
MVSLIPIEEKVVTRMAGVALPTVTVLPRAVL